jgi:sugar O-acyltransferase (sialic acid O-acetyltransferase NeuD family)
MYWNFLIIHTDKMRQVYLYGAGGHAKVVIDILKSNRIRIAGIFDDNPSLHTFMGLPVSRSFPGSPLIVSIGDNASRQRIVERVKDVSFSPALFAQPSVVSEPATVGEGTVVMQGAILQSSVSIGKQSIINTHASIDHDCRIRDYVHIAPGVVLCGNVEIGEGAFIGAGAVVKQDVKIGKWSVIGAGSVVVKDIPDYATAFGNPCKIITKNKQS